MSIEPDTGERPPGRVGAVATRPPPGPGAPWPPLSPRVWWWLLVVLTLAWFGSFAVFPKLFFQLGVNHLGVWFLDTFALLASNDALTLGRDPWVPNSLDYFNRPHVYSHWWLHLRDFGLTRAHTPWVGLVVVTIFLAAAVAHLRPRAPGELGWYALVLFSSPVVLAVDRANNDLVVFALLAAVRPLLLSRSRPLRFLAAVPVAVAAGLKFYPAIAGLVLAAGVEKGETRVRILLAVVLFGLVGWNIAPDLARAGSMVPKAEGLMTFGAINLPAGAGLTGGQAKAVILVLAAGTAAGFLRSRMFDGWRVTSENEGAWLSFVLGASLLVGCFFLSTNFAYRWIFTIWLAPLLWSLPRDPAAPVRVRRLAALTAGLLVFVLWSDALASVVLTRMAGRMPAPELMRRADLFFLAEQPIHWVFFCCLLGFLTHFARENGRRLLARD